MLASVFAAVSAILGHVADEETAASITRFIITPLIDVIKANLKNRLADILHPHLSGHPITYNHYLSGLVRRAPRLGRSGKLALI
ncbi:hypothetical protein F5B17DRAFT_213222 [Nemania serpens]|nr:hypothetical protein F5B17DRAFT_213222 [Nemania serpens]